MTTVQVSSTSLRYQQKITIDQFDLIADEPLELEGDNTGPTPTAYVLAALGSCKAITVKMYAERKQWPLTHVSVSLDYVTINQQPQILAQLYLEGDLTPEQRQRLQQIADKCPIHKLLAGETPIVTQLSAKST